MNRDLLAAGGVLWRRRAGEIEVLLVHRPRYDDWSLPKGKPEPGEHLTVTARREVAEETGLSVPLGRPLGTVEYRVPAGTKQVRYWSMEVTGAQEGPGEGATDPTEIDDLGWVGVGEALTRLSYSFDVDTVRRLAERPVTTTPLLLVRHAHAGDRSSWRGPDRHRPLDARGWRQSIELSPLLRAFGAEHVWSADLARCRQTAEPTARALGVEVQREELFSDVACAADPARTVARLREVAATGPTIVVSQGDAIPMVLAAWGREDGTPLPSGPDGKIPARKGSVWALSLTGTSLVAAEYFPDAVPALG